MTREELIKSLLCCSSTEHHCFEQCALFGEYGDCFNKLMRVAANMLEHDAICMNESKEE